MTILAWQRGGPQGGRAVVCVHSWAADGVGDWEATGWVETLGGAGFAVLVPDLPGHGESSDVLVPPDAEPASWAAQAITADLDRLHVGSFAAAGYAEGCLVAGHLAVRLPERVPRLVLLGCDDRVGPTHREEVAGALRDPQARLWSVEASDAVARARRDRRHHLPTLAQWAEAMAWPAAPRLGSLRTPVLLGVGTDDEERRARIPRLAQLFHDARLATAPGDRWSAFAGQDMQAAVTAFLAEQPDS